MASTIDELQVNTAFPAEDNFLATKLFQVQYTFDIVIITTNIELKI